MAGGPTEPVIYEVNTAVWPGALSRAAGRPVTLADGDDNGAELASPGLFVDLGPWQYHRLSVR